MHRRPTPAEDYRKAHMNPQMPSQKTLIKPLNQGLKEHADPSSKSKIESSPYPVDANALFKCLERLKREQDREINEESNKDHFLHKLSTTLETAAKPRVPAAAATAQPDVQDHLFRSLSKILNSRGDDCQSILDQHVSSVFSPRHTPGSTSPKNLHRTHHRSNEMSSSVPDFGKIKQQKLKFLSFT